MVLFYFYLHIQYNNKILEEYTSIRMTSRNTFYTDFYTSAYFLPELRKYSEFGFKLCLTL